MMLTPNQTPRKPSTRGLRSARISESAGTLAAASASPRLNERKLPCTKAKRIAAAIVPDTDAEAPTVTKAHYAVIGDMHEILPAINEELRRRHG